ncbi:hypothetical protein N8I77_007403 [Diaporthe amygdali]|uniref:Heterokaryon incompatibility domain-containing protein n=1 Tax=Phomopsis amygdali TaxID=1214568 RepID=A0AAD9W1J0_PHOAM|nr:hypothetical protein N8I77_007403 [Diaporthe amygdali]
MPGEERQGIAHAQAEVEDVPWPRRYVIHLDGRLGTVSGLILLADQNLQLGQYRVGSFPVDPHTGSNGNFNLARKWLGACRQQHDNCLSARLPQLPTRVIDVGVHPAYKDVRLRVPQPGSKAEYVALSHCWGGEVTPKLAGGNLEEFTVGLPFATLAANFQDAIKVTRELGIRYLWIDCLCILQGSDQGSRADWERESKAMTAVYRDCTLTISALASSKSTDGFLTYESDICRSAERRLIYIDVVPATTGKSWPAWVEKFDPKKEESLFQLEKDGPLARRGWTLQENILSPRHLFYGVNSIHWVCPAGYKSANGMRGMHILDKKYPELSPVLFDGILREKSQAPKCDAEDILLRYYDLVERYSGRALTVTLDKLPAFSAIAQRLQPILGDYIAGLWRRDIIRGMWWVAGTNAVRPLEYRGPSWSWASMDGNIEFTDTSLLREEGPLDSQVLDHSICLVDPTNPFGQVRSGSLTARGLTRRLIRSLEYRRDSSEGFDLFYLHFDEPPKDETCHEGLGEQQESPGTLKSKSDLPEHAPNIIDTGRDPKIKLGSYHVISGKYLVFLLRGHQSHYSDKNELWMRVWCLLLECVPGLRHNVFRRVGTLEGYTSPAEIQKWQQRTIVIE